MSLIQWLAIRTMKTRFAGLNPMLYESAKMLPRRGIPGLLQLLIIVVLCLVFLSVECQGILSSCQLRPCRPLCLLFQRDHSFFVPPRDPLCGQEYVSPVGSFRTCVGTAHTTLQGQDNRGQPSQQQPLPQRENKDMKDEYFSLHSNTSLANNACEFTTDYYEYEQNQTNILVKGRLKQNIDFWRKIGANEFVLDVIENGYTIPFYSLPPKMVLKNNNSALSNADFVEEAISDLLKRGLAVQCNSLSHCVNPLSVSVQSCGKKRLILDLSLVNKHVWKASVKYEDLRTALTYLNKNDWMIKWDIHSAYHHILLNDMQTDFMGFSWTYADGNTVFMKFVVLPFGLSSAPYCYSKVTRPLIAKWRAESKRAVMYLDDGFGCSGSKVSAEIMAQSIKSDIISSGFVPKAEKSC